MQAHTGWDSHLEGSSTPARVRAPQQRIGLALIGLATLVVALLTPAFVSFLVVPLQAQAGITSPAAGSAISGDVPVIGTADIDSFSKYELHYKLEPSGDDAYVYFDGGTSPITNGQLGIWRAAGLGPGVYSLRLRVVKADGNYGEYFAPNLSVNQGPAPTPTSALPSPTPTSDVPTPTWTPAPSATPNVGAVQQPDLGGTPTATGGDAAAPVATQDASIVQPGDLAAGQSSGGQPTDTAATESETSSLSRELGEALSMERLRGEFVRGMRWSAAIALIAIGLYSAKRIFDWARRRF